MIQQEMKVTEARNGETENGHKDSTRNESEHKSEK